MTSVVLLYLILTRLKIPGALLAAAIFALHPVMVESVAWMSEQKNTLSAVFCLSAMLAYLKFDESRRGSYYITSMCLFVLGLLTKTAITATLPVTLLVIFWWQRGELTWKRDLRPLVPFFLLGAMSGLVTAWVERKLIGAEGVDFELTLLQRALVASRVIWFYLSKLVLPANLVFFYPRWDINPSVWWQWIFPIATLGTFAGLWALRRRWRGPLAAWLVFIATLFPVLGFLNVYPFIFSFVADHFQYLASLPIIVLVSAGVATVLEHASLPIRRSGVALCIVMVGTLAILTLRQSRMYADVVTLYRTTIERNPDSWAAHNNLGTILSAQGHQQEAIEHYRAAIRIRPNYFTAHSNLGIALAATGQLPEAFAHLHKAIELQPISVDAHRQLGNALSTAGRQAEAIEAYQAALLLNPEDPLTLNSLGAALTNVGRFSQAIEHLQHAVRINPDYAEARGSLGNALARSGNYSDGIAELQRALALAPQDAWTLSNLGIALVQAGRLAEAIQQFTLAVQLSPSAYAYNNLGAAMMKADRLPEAIDQFYAAIRLDPDFVQAYANLAESLKLSNRAQEAIAAAEKGSEIARSTGDNALTGQLEEWLTQMQTELRRKNDVQSSPPSFQPAPKP
jgi:tetratricopeptide (TPR) repeat protein